MAGVTEMHRNPRRVVSEGASLVALREEALLPRIPLILKLDSTGRPLRWIDWRAVVGLYARERVAWASEELATTVHGGTNALTGRQSHFAVPSIVAVRGRVPHRAAALVPPLTNHALFVRDHYTCLYCGSRYGASRLTRDHVVPMSRGGENSWKNSVTSCAGCNNRKADAPTPEAVGMRLLAVPYEPSYIEFLVLSNRRILADQMDLLSKHVPTERIEARARQIGRRHSGAGIFSALS